MTRRIFFIDDEAYYTRPYRDRLQDAGYEVVLEDSIQSAPDRLVQELKSGLALIVLDMQLSRPERIGDAEWSAYHGLSGYWLLANHARYLREAKVPVLILTNMNPATFEPDMRKQQLLPPRCLRVCRKIDTPAKVLPSIVGAFLSEAHDAW